MNSDGTITITIPEITAVSMSPNPIETQALLKISVNVSEVQKILYPEWPYSGELYAGE